MKILEYKYPRVGSCDVPSAIALGFFDGVHKGHRVLLSECVRIAKEEGLTPAVFTFPAEDMAIKGREARIYSTEEKLRIFAEAGIELVILADFSSVCRVCPESFIKDILVGDLSCRVAVSGADFRFGHRAEGDHKLLKAKMEECGRHTLICDMECVELPCGERIEISSSAIRKYMADGNISTANLLLGSPFSILSPVKHGRGAGRGLGYPTINTELPTGVPLARGVYITDVIIGGERHRALSNVGVCPTFGKREEHIESFILDFVGNVYGEYVRIEFLEYLRPEMEFSGKEDLISEIKRNIVSAKEYI